MNKLKLILAAITSFVPYLSAIPVVMTISVNVAEAAYTQIRLESFEAETAKNAVRLESQTFSSRMASLFANLFPSRRASPTDINRTASILNAITPAAERAFEVSNLRWGMISGPEDANIAFNYQNSNRADGGYDMAIFYFNQMPPAEFLYSASEAVKSSNKILHAVVGVDYLNCYSNDAQTHKALLLSADSSCATEPSELDFSAIAPDESSNTITLPISVIYNSSPTGSFSESDYITIGLYAVNAEGEVTSVESDAEKHYFTP